MTGKIKTLRADKGFGFIRDDGGREYFFHQGAIYGEGIDMLRVGDSVEYTVGPRVRGLKTSDARPPSEAPLLTSQAAVHRN
jgi:CspA family cold shock protein